MADVYEPIAGVWKAGASDTPPSLTELESSGYPTSGDPRKGQPATNPGAGWYYMMDQMRNSVIKAAGLDLALPPDPGQFLAALKSMAWLEDNLVPGAKLKDGTVTSAKIVKAAIVAKLLADSAVETAKIKDAAVTAAKIAAGSIDSGKIKDKSIAFGDLADAAIATEAQALAGTAGNVLMTPLLVKKLIDKLLSGETDTGIPPGTLCPFAGNTVPDGWLLCNGANVSRTTYANLFKAIGTIWGSGDGKTTFRLPDFSGRHILGTTSPLSVGRTVSAGLPDITGTVKIGNYPLMTSDHKGAFYAASQGNADTHGQDTSRGASALGFAASNSNGIYGNSSTVQVPASYTLIIIRA